MHWSQGGVDAHFVTSLTIVLPQCKHSRWCTSTLSCDPGQLVPNIHHEANGEHRRNTFLQPVSRAIKIILSLKAVLLSNNETLAMGPIGSKLWRSAAGEFHLSKARFIPKEARLVIAPNIRQLEPRHQAVSNKQHSPQLRSSVM